MCPPPASSWPALPAARTAGVCLHLTSLPGPHGIGDLGAVARQALDTLCSMQVGVWQFLPTGPTAAPAHSPYLPLSAFAGNELLIGVDELQRAGLLRPDETAVLEALPRGTVDYERLCAAKPALLERAAARFEYQAGAGDKRQRDAFVAACDDHWLHDYALFRLLRRRHAGRPWPQWEASLAQREPAALRRVATRFADELRVLKTMQYFFDRQWRELQRYAAQRAIRLFGDLPIYVPLDGADAWSHPELFQLGADGWPRRVAGVPPDYYSEDGQLWGNPLYDWPQHRAQHYAWWTARLRHATAQADLVRIDHFRGFEAYWSVPFGAASARDGEWRTGPGGDLFDALQRALGPLPIVAENLGMITAAVEALRTRYGMPGMRVLQFDLADERFTPASIREDCVYYTGTHDNDTLLGWYRGAPGDTRNSAEIASLQQRIGELTGATGAAVSAALVKLAFDSAARLAVAPMQDLLGLGAEARLNTPGTITGNWRWRLDALPRAAQCRPVAAIVRATHRAG